jgi:hypothetical protein
VGKALISVIVVCIAASSLAHGATVDDSLYISIAEKSTDELKRYLSEGGSPSAALQVPGAASSLPLLELALRSSNQEAAKLLLSAGAQPDSPNLALEIAAGNGLAGVVEALLDQDPTRVLRLRRENHPLVLAAGRGYKDVVSVLSSRMANIAGAADRQGIMDEASVAAISSYSPTNDGLSIIKALLSAGASASSTSVLAGALLACDPQLIETFLGAGGDPKRHYDLVQGGRLPVEYAMQCFSRTGVPITQAERVLGDLVSAGADLCPRELDQSEIPPAARSAVERLRTCH